MIIYKLIQMKTKSWPIFLILAIFMSASFCIFGCLGGDDDDDTTEGNNTTTENDTTDSVREYFGALSVGDLMDIVICENNHTIWYRNRYTGSTGWANYTVNSDGSYNVTVPGGEIYKAVELKDYAVVAYMPRNNTANGTLVALNLQSGTNLTNIADNYTYVMHDSSGTDYGYAEALANGTVYVNETSRGTTMNFTMISNGDGTFNCSGGGTDNWTGMALPNNVMMFDLGAGQGFVVGVKRPDAALDPTDVVGNWTLIRNNGQEGVAEVYNTTPTDVHVNFTIANGPQEHDTIVQDTTVHGLFNMTLSGNKLIVLPDKMVIWVDIDTNDYGFALYQEP